jgi:hypothetical protein
VIHVLGIWVNEQDKARSQQGIRHKTVEVEADFMEKIKHRVKPSLFIMSNFLDLQINIYCEKNERH